MNLAKIFAAAVVVAALCTPVHSQDKAKEAKWEELRSEAGNFIAWLPAKAEYEKKPLKTADGDNDHHMFTVDLGAKAYIISYIDYTNFDKNADPEKVLDGARNGAVGDGKLLKERKKTMSRFPGRVVICEKGEFRIEDHIFLVKNRLYQAIAVGPKDNFDDKEARKVLDSLKLLEEPD